MSSDRENVRVILSKLKDLPTLPTVVSQITGLMQNPRTSASEIGEALSKDPSLASRTLKLVNSAFYGFPGRINTIAHAIVILGFTSVKNLVLTASIFELMGKRSKVESFNLEAFWLHSVSTGAAAKILAETLKFKFLEEVFIGGVLHDIGKVVFSVYTPNEYGMVMRYRDAEDCLLLEAEKAIIKVTHHEMGGWVAEKWNLPKDLSAMIQYHHMPQLAGNFKVMAGIVHVADIICRGLGYGSGGDDLIPCVNDAVWDQLKMNKVDFQKLLSRTEEEIEKASMFLQAM